jgi:ABC-type multidrug transport system ATPase subunit
MSCGERRRIALAMALIADPSILLLDEPLSDLDFVGVKDTVSTLKELKNRGLCIIVSSHRLEDILELTDKIAVLGEGRLLMIDEPQKVLTNEEILKLAAVTLPSIPRLFLRLQAEGVLASTKLPLSMDQAIDRIKEAVALNLEATQALTVPGEAKTRVMSKDKAVESADADSKTPEPKGSDESDEKDSITSKIAL